MRIETFDQYQREIDSICLYPNDSDGIKALFFALIGASARVGECLKDSILNGHKIIQEDKDKIAEYCAEAFMYLSAILNAWNIPVSRFVYNNDINNFGSKLRAEPAIIYRYGVRLIFTTTQFANISISGYLIPDIKKAHTITITVLICTILRVLNIDLNDAFSDFITKQKKESKYASNKTKQIKDKESDSVETTKGSGDQGTETGSTIESGGKVDGQAGRSKVTGKPSRSPAKQKRKTTGNKSKTGQSRSGNKAISK